MKRVLLRSIKFYSLVILSLTVIMMCESSCTQEETIGRPSATFILKGTVLSAEDLQPLKDIHITMLADTIKIDTAITDQDGKFKLINSLAIPAEVSYIIKFRELDNELKSSNVIIDSTTIYSFKNLTFINGDGHWYSGETTREWNVILKPKMKVTNNASN